MDIPRQFSFLNPKRKSFHILAMAALCAAGGCTKAPAPSSTDPDAAQQQRVISLAPSLTEIVCAIGGRDMLVGRTSACDFPPDIAGTVPVVGNFGNPSLELLVAASPTLILDAALADETLGRKIEQLGLRRERIRSDRLDEVPDAIERIGTLIGLDSNAQKIAAELRNNITALRTHAASVTGRPMVYVETWNDPMWTEGKGSVMSDIIYLAGGRNIGDEINKDHFQVSPEWVLSRNPDIILCLYMARKDSARDSVINRPGWEHVSAIKTKRVYDGFNNDTMLRPGPRVIEGIMTLEKIIGNEE